MRTVIIATLALLSATAASAQQANAPTDVVRFADLNLHSDIGKRELAKRIARATEAVCGSYAGLREDSEIVAVDDCRREARVEGERRLAAILRFEVRTASR
ncbi:MAG TPA: UrcA family protein [Sphingomicrobium sp.]|nr:UrcA family protein [Sphingomicrobium sp.]